MMSVERRVALGLSAERAAGCGLIAGCGLAAMASGFSDRPGHPGFGPDVGLRSCLTGGSD